MPENSPFHYFDYAATTPLAPEVLAQLQADLSRPWGFANCGATYRPALENRRLLEAARAQFAAVIHADPREIVFTSGATEANNLALKGALQYHGASAKHLITVQTEHKAILDPANILAKMGIKVTVLPVQKNGQIALADLERALQQPTTLVSVMAVNNETGAWQPLAEIAALCRRAGAKLHLDAAQALGKLPFDVQTLPVDMMSFSGHKIYAPKGIGALYVRRLPKMRLQAQMHGGGQERGLRSGTSPLALIRALALAAELAENARPARYHLVQQRQQELLAALPAGFLDNLPSNGHVPHINSIVTPFFAADILAAAERAGLALSAGSACQAGAAEGSHVLRAMGLGDAATHSVRVSLSHLTTPAEIATLQTFFHQLLAKKDDCIN